MSSTASLVEIFYGNETLCKIFHSFQFCNIVSLCVICSPMLQCDSQAQKLLPIASPII